MAIAITYACTDEFHQHFVSGRHGTPVDVGIDAIGAATAAILIARRRT
jgi:VanZ family protein